MYAIIDNGGKQYKVAAGEKIAFDLIKEAVAGQEITFNQVLLVGGDNPVVGKPLVSGASVVGEVIGHEQDKKIIVYKKKRRKGYQKKQGHRQDYTQVLITKINA